MNLFLDSTKTIRVKSSRDKDINRSTTKEKIIAIIILLIKTKTLLIKTTPKFRGTHSRIVTNFQRTIQPIRFKLLNKQKLKQGNSQTHSIKPVLLTSKPVKSQQKQNCRPYP